VTYVEVELPVYPLLGWGLGVGSCVI